IVVVDFHENRHRYFAIILKLNQISFRYLLRTGDAQINISGPVKPTFPKPIEVFTRHVFDRVEKIAGSGMFVCPSIDVSFKSRIKPLRADDVFPQQYQTDAWFPVARHSEVTQRG